MRSLGLIAIAVAVALSCTHHGNAEPAPPPERQPEPGGRTALGDFRVALGETVAVEDEGLELTFAAVFGDSRCPEDVQCVWAGNAEIGVEAVRADEPEELLRLNTHSSYATAATYLDYTIELVGLEPVPRTDRKAEPEYVATLTVHKAE